MSNKRVYKDIAKELVEAVGNLEEAEADLLTMPLPDHAEVAAIAAEAGADASEATRYGVSLRYPTEQKNEQLRQARKAAAAKLVNMEAQFRTALEVDLSDAADLVLDRLDGFPGRPPLEIGKLMLGMAPTASRWQGTGKQPPA